ncbi:MAG: zinc ABC transporter substrate-binding protein [Chloroflexi bacterium]|nr:zinc ABC transporter substrate-binding protein [Chloroflexota bacterium]
MNATRPMMRLHLNTMSGRLMAGTLTLALTAAACAGNEPAATGVTLDGTTTRVVATTTVLADLVAQVGGDLVTVTPLVPLGGEVHTFDPSPSDAVTISEAELVVMNGLGLDEWLRDLAQTAGPADVTIVELAEDLGGVDYLEPAEHEGDAAEDEEGADEPEEDDDHAGESANPHLWLNVTYTQEYVEKLVAALKQVDPDNAARYDANATEYQQELTDLDAWVREQMATVPNENRRVISFHEAFPYFAAAYDLEIVGTVIDAPGQDPSAAQVAGLIEAIRDEGVSAIFAESQFPSDLTQTIAEETDVPVVTDLYNDSLGPAPADTYVGLIEWDVERIVQALQ